MCGIAGLVARRAGAPAPASLVETMCEALVHRGPDEAAVETYGRCVLGSRRLRVIDLAPTGHQPVANERGDVFAVLNGEIYNFAALRAELGGRGHEIPGTGDTQVLPHLYEEHGPGFVERLEGMFAVALWDAARERLVLARDRLGKKPLVWTTLPDGTLAFASEVKALVGLPGFDRAPSPEALDAYLALGYVPADRSAFACVERLPPAHSLVVEGEARHVRRYWQPSPVEPAADDGEWLERVRTEVTAAVRRRLVADVPLGALLSGGIDSSVVVATMAQAGGRPVRTFSVGFRDERYDERRWARLVAERYGTQHEELVVEPDAASLLAQLAWAFDEPFADSSALPTFVVCELARRHVTVALTGDGGDEAFGGYERYRAHALAGRLPGSVGRGAARVARRFPGARRDPRSPLARGARLLALAGLPPAERYGAIMELFPEPLRRALWTDDARAELGGVRSAGELLGTPRHDGTAALQRLDVDTYLPGDLLVKADIASMAHSLELRSPLLDHRVVELGLALPERLIRRGWRGKEALRRAFAADLPAPVRRRRKRGFGVPVSRWFRGELRPLAEDVLLGGRLAAQGLFRTRTIERLLADHVSGAADHGARLWALVMLEHWLRLYVDGEAVAARPAARTAAAAVSAS